MSENNFKWYALRAISGKESKVKEYIELESRVTELGQYVSQVLIPTEKVYQIRNGKKITKERSAMPGYVLVEAHLVGDTLHRLRSTPNVLGFLGEKGNSQNAFIQKPTSIRAADMSRILGTMDEMLEIGEELLVPYYAGENVKVIFGPFSGFSGVIEEVNEEKKKLKVMVMIFGRKTPLELSFTQVEKE